MKKLLRFTSVLVASTMLFASCAPKPPVQDAPSASAPDTSATTEANASAEASASAEAKKEEPKQKLKYALLLPGPVNDGGWSSAAFTGLKRIQHELGYEVSYSESVPQSNVEEIFRNYAAAGYNVIIGHGFQFGDACLKVAKEFPDTKFIVTSSTISQEPNVASFETDPAEMGFLQGIAAAYMSKSGKIAAIGSVEIPPLVQEFKSYEAGAKFVKPDIVVNTVIIGSNDDSAKAKDTALSLIENGVDIITVNADSAGLGAFEACREKNVLAIGSVTDQRSIAPEVIFFSVVSDIPEAFKQLATDIDSGAWKPQFYRLGASRNVTRLTDFGDFDSQFPTDGKDKLAEVTEKFKNEEINAKEITDEYFKNKK